MSDTERMPPEGRMFLSVLLGLFFAGFAFGSLHTALQEYRWRNALVVRGVLVKRGSQFHYEYRPPGNATVSGPNLTDQSSGKPNGIIDDRARLEYDPAQREKLRRHVSRGRASTNYGQFLITASAGAVFSVLVLICVWFLLRAWYDKRHPSELEHTPH